MSQIQTLVNYLHRYYALPHHDDKALSAALDTIQSWQRQRIHRENLALFHQPNTAPLAHFLIDRIYNHATFDIIAEQLLTAGNNALGGSGKLEKLVPKNALSAGLISVLAAINAIELDLALAQYYIANFANDHADDGSQAIDTIDDALMIHLYQAVDAKDARIEQIAHIGEVCRTCYQSFNSFLLYKAFGLAKKTAYHNGYQPLYDFIHDGLHAIKCIDNIEDFTVPFIQTETAIIRQIHG
ncbi:FFLEELY motif protein [Moraxella marmotae]|uniref:FFLEELY motif protein n=1 Tax=Moraxella marmotae TaxID=3344520 RepID=UPI0035F37E16